MKNIKSYIQFVKENNEQKFDDNFTQNLNGKTEKGEVKEVEDSEENEEKEIEE